MNTKELTKHLENVLGNTLSTWEIDELVEKIRPQPSDLQAAVLQQIPVIWPVSYALFHAFVEQAANAVSLLPHFSTWVSSILDVYESEGLRKAQLFMENAEIFAEQLHGKKGLTFSEVEARLTPYLTGIAGQRITIAPAKIASTDTNTIFLPANIDLFPDNNQNFLLYKLTATFQLALSQKGTFNLKWLPDYIHKELYSKYKLEAKESVNPLEKFFSLFPDYELASSLFYLVEAERIMVALDQEFPGLIHDCREILLKLTINYDIEGSSPKITFFSKLRHNISHPSSDKSPLPKTPPSPPVEASLNRTIQLYNKCESLPGQTPAVKFPFMGKLSAKDAYKGITQRREEIKKEFINALAALIIEHKGKHATQTDSDQSTQASSVHDSDQGLLLLIPPQKTEQKEGYLDSNVPPIKFITIGTEQVAMSEDLSQLTAEIQHDLGNIPGDYTSSAIGMAGSGLQTTALTPEAEGLALNGSTVYDEWDFRRTGFRKNWCNLIEKEIIPTRGTFVADTLSKYKGQLITLRRQFEAMSLQERFVRRQREGNDIDLDAVVEAITDMQTGRPPSDHLFVRLQKNERDIATLFLVDMSNSTEGWIGKALKESLILMSESLALLGDRYAIYGFSGMRRSRCEFFTIKTFDETYDMGIKGKISAIAPKEYTRMGPAIRHATKLLGGVEAKIRLLITLSDGKPEDYDGYKGAYAIEDTRHALIEAKSSGIHPFCITVDRQAHDYIGHMYGEVNYIFIDDVTKLPRRMPDVYRNLTT